MTKKAQLRRGGISPKDVQLAINSYEEKPRGYITGFSSYVTRDNKLIILPGECRSQGDTEDIIFETAKVLDLNKLSREPETWYHVYIGDEEIILSAEIKNDPKIRRLTSVLTDKNAKFRALNSGV